LLLVLVRTIPFALLDGLVAIISAAIICIAGFGALVLGEQLLHEFCDLELEIDRLDIAVNVRNRFGAENVAIYRHGAALFVDLGLILFQALLQVLFGEVQVVDFDGRIFVALEQFDARETRANEISHQNLKLEQQHTLFARVEIATRGQETFAPLAELRIYFKQNFFEFFELVVREGMQHEIDEQLSTRIGGADGAIYRCSIAVFELMTVAEHVATRVFEQLMAQPEREQVIRCAVVLQVIAKLGVKVRWSILINERNC